MTDLMDFRVAPEFADLPVLDPGEGIVSGFSSIRIKGKAWALRHQGETYYFNTPTIDVVILASASTNSQAYYPDQYNEDNEGRAPICTSLDAEHVDPDVEEPQAKSCLDCPRNVWKGPRGERKKECQTYHRMAVLLIPTDSAKLLGTGPLLEPVFLKIPPGSLQNLKKYGAFLKEKNVPMQSCITTLGFAPPNVSLFAITFKCTQMLKGGEAKTIRPLIGGVETQRLIGEAKIIHEVADEQPPLEPPKKVKTGIEEAFAKRGETEEVAQEVIPPKRGRPPGSKNRPKESEDINGGRVGGFAVSDVDTRGTDTPPKQASGFQGLQTGSPELTQELDKLDKMLDD